MTIRGLTNKATGLNTGKSESALFPALVVSGILVPYGWTFPISVGDSDVTILANLETALTDLLTNDSYADRGFYVGPFEAFNDKSEATTYQTLGYGRKIKTQRQILTKEYQIVEGGVQYWRALQSFTGKVNEYKWLEIDSEGVIYGTNVYTFGTSTVTGMQGIRLSALEPQDRKQANKSTVEEHILNLTIQDSAEVNEGLFTIETGLELDSMLTDIGVQDVTMQADGVMSVIHMTKLRVLTSDGGIDIVITLPGLVDASLLVCYNGDTLLPIAILSATIVGNEVHVTIDHTDPNFFAGRPALFGLAVVSALVTGGFSWYECSSAEAVATATMV